MALALSVLMGLLMLVTVLPMSYSQHYSVRSCDFIRLQVFYAAVFVAIGALYLVWRDGGMLSEALLSLAILVMVIQGKWIYPYTVLAKKEVLSAPSDATHSIRIMSANVLMSNHNSQRLLELVAQHQPDILITLESDDWWEQQLAGLKAHFAHTVFCAKDNRYGMHLFSKVKIIKAQICELIEQDIPSIHVLFERDCGLKMQGHFIHPAPPSPTEEDTSRPRDSELIIVAKALKNCSRPVIVAGDLNDVAWSRTTRLFMQISGLLDPRKGRGFFNTFHASYFFMRWPLDHLFHSTGFKVRNIQRLAKYGSDHFALLTELVFSQAEQQSLETKPVAEQKRESQELVAKTANKHQVPIFD